VSPQRKHPQHILKDVWPCMALAQCLRPCYGPHGLPKCLLFHCPQGFSNLSVNSQDRASALAYMNLSNPQVFTLISAATKQVKEYGDGAGLVLLLASSLLAQASHLLTLGVTGAEIQAGYRLGCGRALVLLEQEICGRLLEPREELQVRAILRPFLACWQPGLDSLLEAVVARCCVGEVWEGVTFAPTCVRVCIELQGAPQATASDTEDNKEAEEEGEGKGEQETEVTGEMSNGEGKKEEEKTSEKPGQNEDSMKKAKKQMSARSGWTWARRYGKRYQVGQKMMEALQQYTLSKIHGSPRKKRQPLNTKSANPQLNLPLQVCMEVEEPLDADACPKVSVTLRSPDQALLNSAQAAVNASLKLYHSFLVEPRLVPGAGAAEVALAVGLTREGLGLVGMEQLVVHAFSQALLEPAKTLGVNSGTPADLAVFQQYGRHWGRKEKGTHACEQPQKMNPPLKHDQEMEQGVMDGLGCKASTIQKATEATLAILSDLLSQTGEE
uniref:Uncharacterized protein n=1 Tax=Myripristis murdjan TaxID=586833 RepID=A0A667XTM7_9TELE